MSPAFAHRTTVLPASVKTGITYSRNMKTAISIDEALLKEADKTASQMGLSRSRLFTIAVVEFLRQKRDEQMLHRLNEVYAKGPEPSQKRLLKGMKAKFRATVKESW